MGRGADERQPRLGGRRTAAAMLYGSNADRTDLTASRPSPRTIRYVHKLATEIKQGSFERALAELKFTSRPYSNTQRQLIRVIAQRLLAAAAHRPDADEDKWKTAAGRALAAREREAMIADIARALETRLTSGVPLHALNDTDLSWMKLPARCGAPLLQDPPGPWGEWHAERLEEILADVPEPFWPERASDRLYVHESALRDAVQQSHPERTPAAVERALELLTDRLSMLGEHIRSKLGNASPVSECRQLMRGAGLEPLNADQLAAVDWSFPVHVRDGEQTLCGQVIAKDWERRKDVPRGAFNGGTINPQSACAECQKQVQGRELEFPQAFEHENYVPLPESEVTAIRSTVRELLLETLGEQHSDWEEIGQRITAAWTQGTAAYAARKLDELSNPERWERLVGEDAISGLAELTGAPVGFPELTREQIEEMLLPGGRARPGYVVRGTSFDRLIEPLNLTNQQLRDAEKLRPNIGHW